MGLKKAQLIIVNKCLPPLCLAEHLHPMYTILIIL